MATEEWKKEVLKHEDYIKNLEEKYKKKCEDMEVCWICLLQNTMFTFDVNHEW